MTDGGVQFTGVAMETGTGTTRRWRGGEALRRSVAWAAKTAAVVVIGELLLLSVSLTADRGLTDGRRRLLP